MHRILENLAKSVYLRSMAEAHLVAAMSEMHKDKPDLKRMCEAAESARSALSAMRPVQASIERKTFLILSALVYGN